MRFASLLLGIIWILGWPGASQATESGSEIIFQAMEEEMSRTQSQLKLDTFNPPYFVNYQLRDHHRAKVSGSFGALIESQISQKRTLYVDVRIGDPQFDSSTPGSHQYTVKQLVPLDSDIESLKRAIWYETDLRYKQAIMNYLKKKGRFISGVETHEVPDFSMGAPPVVRIKDIPAFNPDLDKWKKLVRKISALYKQDPNIEKSRVDIYANQFVRYYYDSEKNKIQDSTIYYGVVLEAWSKTPKGLPIHDQEAVYFRNPEKFPSEKELAMKVNKMIHGVRELKRAAEMEPYIGPAIFSPDAAAVLFHEALGHRLEGDRIKVSNDGKTFLKKIGKQILPSFLTVIDDPTVKSFAGQDLIGHYQFDDEGQKSSEVVLIDHGILQNFLLSRSPVLGFSKSNGHARGDGIRTPMSRMSNFIVESDQRFSKDLLMKKLIQQIREQNKPYGLLIDKIMGGETQTESGGFQVFKGKPLYLYKIFPDGRRELVQGVEFVGTPLSILGKIIAIGKDQTVVNGFCKAESGFLPVTSITSSILLSEMELQTSQGQRLRPPILPPPHL